MTREQITQALRALNHTHCSDFLYGFGGKDADLSPEGCCGISEVVAVSEGSVTVRVEGHKTISSPEDWEVPDDISEEQIEELVEFVRGHVCEMGDTAEWTGDEWQVTAQRVCTVSWESLSLSEKEIPTALDMIITEAERAAEEFQRNWVIADKYLDVVYKEAASGAFWYDSEEEEEDVP